MKSKKGALELSMSTIIIVVIGVTLLILGLTFVKGIFGKISGISEETFDKARELLVGLEDVNELLTISPSQTEIEQDGDDAIKVIIANFGEKDITIKAETTSPDDKIDCAFADTLTSTSEQYILISGSQKSLALLIKDEKGPLRITSCNVIIEGAPMGEDNQQSVVIKVIKPSSLLG